MKNWLVTDKETNKIFVFDDKKLIKFTDKQTSDAYDFINNTETAIQWLEENGYRVEELFLEKEVKENTDYLKELVNDLLSRLEEFESASETIKYLLNIGYDRKQILKMGFFEEDYNWASKELQDEICGEE